MYTSISTGQRIRYVNYTLTVEEGRREDQCSGGSFQDVGLGRCSSFPKWQAPNDCVAYSSRSRPTEGRCRPASPFGRARKHEGERPFRVEPSNSKSEAYRGDGDGRQLLVRLECDQSPPSLGRHSCLPGSTSFCKGNRSSPISPARTRRRCRTPRLREHCNPPASSWTVAVPRAQAGETTGMAEGLFLGRLLFPAVLSCMEQFLQQRSPILDLGAWLGGPR